MGMKKIAYSEGKIVNWFENNYKKLGFEKIIKKQWNKTPDFIMMKDGKEIKVEIEYLSSDFIKHRHKISEADVVICCKKDVELEGIEVISLEHIFIPYWTEIYPKINILEKKFSSDDLRFLVDGWNKKRYTSSLCK